MNIGIDSLQMYVCRPKMYVRINFMLNVVYNFRLMLIQVTFATHHLIQTTSEIDENVIIFADI